MGLSISKADFNKELSSVGLKTMREELTPGDTLSLESIREYTRNGSDEVGRLLLCKSEKTGVLIRVPFAEFNRMKCDEDLIEAEGENYNLPDAIHITSVSPRVNTEGKEVFPIQAYSLWEREKENERPDFTAVYQSPLKEGHGFKPVSDYEVTIK